MKKRIDQLLVERGFFNSRTRAQAAILEGVVFVNGIKISKSGTRVLEDSQIEITKEVCPYVSRGGLKLEKALREFKVKVKEKIALDVGASTGGFTDCLLQQGISKVYAIDVGYGQLAWRLRQDPKVIPVERTNIRYLTPEKLYKEEKTRAHLCTADVSFISLEKILSSIKNLLEPEGEVMALVKPQFEAGREEVERGGLIRDKRVHQSVLRKVATSAQEQGFKVLSFTPSPLKGADGNIEFFMYLTKNQKRKGILDLNKKIRQVVEQAHKVLS